MPAQPFEKSSVANPHSYRLCGPVRHAADLLQQMSANIASLLAVTRTDWLPSPRVCIERG